MIDSSIKNCLNSQTARILKNEELKKSNYIKALEYQAEETRLHKEELKKQFKEDKNLKTFGDILSIELSSLYSDNGQNWIKALAMTILITAFCFTIFYMPDVFYIDKIFNEENYISLIFHLIKIYLIT